MGCSDTLVCFSIVESFSEYQHFLSSIPSFLIFSFPYFKMRTTLGLIAAIVGTVSATPHLYGYGDSHNVPSGSAPTKGYSTGVKPSYVKPSDSAYVPIPSGHSHTSLHGTHGPYTKTSGTGYIHSSSIHTVHSGTATTLSGTGPKGTSSVPIGTGSKSIGTKSSHIKSSGTGYIHSSSIHSVPSGTSTTPSGTGPKGSSSVSVGTGSVTKSVPASTGHGEQGKTTPGGHGHTYTITGNVPSTTTVTHYGTTTHVETITTFVPCSTPIATSESSTYYSSYLTVSYSTRTFTSTITDVEVICPAATPSHNQATGGFGHASNYESAASKPAGGSGHEYNVVSEAGSGSGPSTPAASYAPHTVYNSAPAPTAGICPAEKTVYSTVVLEITKTIPASAPTHCAVCETYTFTLPNGSPITTVIPTTYASSTQTISPGGGGSSGGSGGKPQPPIPGSHNGTLSYPIGTGTGTGHFSRTKTSGIKPSVTGAYGYGFTE